MSYQERISVLRKRQSIAEDVPVGFAGSYGVGSQVATTPDGGMILSLVITNDSVDMDGDIVDPNGADWTYWRQRGFPVYMEHQYGIAETVGRGRQDSLKMVPMPGGLSGWSLKVGLLKNELGIAVAEYVREFGQIGSSIGFRIMDARAPGASESSRTGLSGMKATRIITKWLALENSLTCNPCNTLAGGGPTDQSNKMLQNLESLVSRGVITKSIASTLGLPEPAKPVLRKETRVVFVR